MPSAFEVRVLVFLGDLSCLTLLVKLRRRGLQDTSTIIISGVVCLKWPPVWILRNHQLLSLAWFSYICLWVRKWSPASLTEEKHSSGYKCNVKEEQRFSVVLPWLCATLSGIGGGGVVGRQNVLTQLSPFQQRLSHSVCIFPKRLLAALIISFHLRLNFMPKRKTITSTVFSREH